MTADDGTRHDRAMTRTDTPPPPVREPADDDARPLDAAEIDSAEWSIWAGWETAGRMHTHSGGAVPTSPAAGTSVAGPPTPPRSDAYRTGDHRPVRAGARSGGVPSGESTTTVDGDSGNGAGAAGAGAAAAGAAGAAAAGAVGSGPTKVVGRSARAGGPTPPGGRRPASRVAAPDPAVVRRRRALAVLGLWAACLLVGLLVGGLIGDDHEPTVNFVEVEGSPDDWRAAPAPGPATTGGTADDEPGQRPDRPDRPDNPRRTTTTLDPTATTGPGGSSTTTTARDDREPAPGEDVTTTTTEPDGTTTTTADPGTTSTSTSTTSTTTTTTTPTTTATTLAADTALAGLIPF
jgi:hypothetical protein